ncbi:MAG: hypothetical protein M0D57_15870 [Sphingobacteriales bacterium JAD_PAG50586_3]|nr:MAG: hypothetical protein M0D57_15870 [Sphingobacteriales bacterium JAD_PAG50586_3]
MKKLYTIALLLLCLCGNAQKLTFTDIVGTYHVSKLYLSDTLVYDLHNPAKADKNILIDVGKQIAMYTNVEDTTLALALFYKDIKKALSTTVIFKKDSTTYTSYSGGYYGDDMITRFVYTEHWAFDEKKQRVKVMRNGKVTEQMPAARVNGKVVLYIDDKKEKTKLEMERMY